MDFRISEWISGFQFGFLDFSLDSGFQFGFLLTVYEISFMTDPSLEAPGHGHQLGLHGIRLQDLGLPNEYSLGKLASQAGIMHYSQLLTLKHSTKLLFFFSRSKLLF